MSDDRLDYYRAASQAYRTACTAYRSREIDDETYLAYRDAWKASQREYNEELTAERFKTFGIGLSLRRGHTPAGTPNRETDMTDTIQQTAEAAAVRSEDAASYGSTATSGADTLTDDQTIQRALDILSSRLREPGCVLTTPDTVRDFLRLQLAASLWEEFSVIWLDNRHRVISFDKLFRGTIDGASVPPREVVRAAMEHNAAAAIFAHNHPSGVAEPSQADIRITQRLKEALALIDVRVLDHFVVGGDAALAYCSMAERKLI